MCLSLYLRISKREKAARQGRTIGWTSAAAAAGRERRRMMCCVSRNLHDVSGLLSDMEFQYNCISTHPCIHQYIYIYISTCVCTSVDAGSGTTSRGSVHTYTCDCCISMMYIRELHETKVSILVEEVRIYSSWKHTSGVYVSLSAATRRCTD